MCKFKQTKREIRNLQTTFLFVFIYQAVSTEYRRELEQSSYELSRKGIVRLQQFRQFSSPPPREIKIEVFSINLNIAIFI